MEGEIIGVVVNLYMKERVGQIFLRWFIGMLVFLDLGMHARQVIAISYFIYVVFLFPSTV